MVQPTAFPDRLDSYCVKKKGDKDDCQIFGLSDWQSEIAIYEMVTMEPVYGAG